MKNQFRILFIASVIGCTLSACKKDSSTEQPFLGYNYFPLAIGSEKIYEVDSIGYLGWTFDPGTGTVEIDTQKYFIKEVVESYFTDNEGRQTARIVRLKRMNDTDPWTIYKVWSANLTATTAERYEDNIRYIKLVFPPKENEKWNGNSLNTNEAWEYEYENVNESGKLGLLSFDSTLTVIQIFDPNFVSYRYYVEQYAANTGMFYKENNNYEYGLNGNIIKNGFKYKETLISFKP